MPPSTAAELAATLRAELEQVLAVKLTQKHESWLVGTELIITVPAISWQGVQESLDSVVEFSPMIHGHWADGEDALFVLMGVDVWQSTRCDRFFGSRIHNIANNDAVASTKRMQLVRLEARKRGKSSQHDYIDTHQLMVHVLKASARLSAPDLGLVVNLLADTDEE